MLHARVEILKIPSPPEVKNNVQNKPLFSARGEIEIMVTWKNHAEVAPG